VNSVPFLRFVLDALDQTLRIRRAVFTLGHRGGQVEAFVRAESDRWRFKPLFSREKRLLGTGGGLRLALAKTGGETVLVLNGDTFLRFDPARLVTAFSQSGARAVLLACRVPDASRYGALRLAASGNPAYRRVLGFEEKGRTGKGWINGGTYLLGRKDYLAHTPAGRAFSIEREVLAEWVRREPLSVVAVCAPTGGGRFLDIGDPGAYAGAGRFLRLNTPPRTRRPRPASRIR
jgi:D-glycero-alpha-D-manno-heptose 1-phosphate guanylyltransferase